MNPLVHLVKGLPGGFGLTDDSAVIVAAAGHEFAAKIDALSTDSHFLAGLRSISSLTGECEQRVGSPPG